LEVLEGKASSGRKIAREKVGSFTRKKPSARRMRGGPTNGLEELVEIDGRKKKLN